MSVQLGGRRAAFGEVRELALLRELALMHATTLTTINLFTHKGN